MKSYISRVLSFEQDIISMRFIRPTSFNSITNSIEINLTFCEIAGTEVFVSLHPCDLEAWSRLCTLVSKCIIQQYLSLYQVWTNTVHKHLNACQCQSFGMLSVKQQLLPLILDLDLYRYIAGANQWLQERPNRESAKFVASI